MHYEIERRWLLPDKWLKEYNQPPDNIVKVVYLANNPLFEIRVKRYNRIDGTHLHRLTFKTKGTLKRLEYERTVSENFWNKLITKHKPLSYFEDTKAGYILKIFNKFIIAEKEFTCLQCAKTHVAQSDWLDITHNPIFNLSSIYKNGEQVVFAEYEKLKSQPHQSGKEKS